jgi:delta24-sterol reductase
MIKTDELFEHLLTHYRGIFATLFLLPASVAYGAWMDVRNRIAFRLNSAPAKHDARVQNVIRQIEDWHRAGRSQKLCTARSGWKTMSELVPKYKLSHRKIHVGLHDILGIDEQRQTVRVEPLATMGQVSRSLISRGWTLPVVPELDSLTVGGLIMGFGVETSSHKHGLFQHICTAFEVVTAEGKLLKCSAEENPELFQQIPWSHGTLGFLVAAELKIIPAKPYVRLHYQPVNSLDEMVAAFEAASRDTENNDFVEGLAYSREQAVIMRGQFADALGPDGPVNRIGLWYKPWFYKHVQGYLARNQAGVEYLPLRDYFHRHTRGYFWAMEEIIPFGNHPLFRALLGWAVPPRIELLKYTETETTRRLRERHHVIQDMLLPIRHLKAALGYFDEHFRLYPLWLSPMAIKDNGGQGGFVQPFRDAAGTVDELYVDVGAYGTPTLKNFDNASALPPLEQFVIEHQGYQALYARTTLNRADFRRMFDHGSYDALRKRLPHCRAAFDEVYDKVSSKGRVAPIEMRKLEKSGARAA